MSPKPVQCRAPEYDDGIAAAPDTWPRVRDCAYGQADAVRTGTARCAGPDPCCSGLSMIPPVTRCVVVDLAPQAMIGRVWVCAGSIMTDKTHRQGAITRCIHATECQAALPRFTFTTFTVAHVQFGMHAARAHPHMLSLSLSLSLSLPGIALSLTLLSFFVFVCFLCFFLCFSSPVHPP